TASSVSIALPDVSMETVPLTLGVHVNQSEAPPWSPACSGSPVSFVMPVLSVPSDPLLGSRATALAKSSFGGVVAIADVKPEASAHAPIVAHTHENLLRHFTPNLPYEAR